MNLESDKRLNIQLRLDFSSAPTGTAAGHKSSQVEHPRYFRGVSEDQDAGRR